MGKGVGAGMMVVGLERPSMTNPSHSLTSSEQTRVRHNSITGRSSGLVLLASGNEEEYAVQYQLQDNGRLPRGISASMVCVMYGRIVSMRVMVEEKLPGGSRASGKFSRWPGTGITGRRAVPSKNLVSALLSILSLVQPCTSLLQVVWCF
jgi:hypothetical protein